MRKHTRHLALTGAFATGLVAAGLATTMLVAQDRSAEPPHPEIERILRSVGALDDGPAVAVPFGADVPMLDEPHRRYGSDPLPLGGHLLGLIPAADNIVDLQCPNGGFNWPYGGCANTFTNITAPISMGLLRAYAATGNAAYLESSLDGGDHDLTATWNYGGVAFSSFDPAWFQMLTEVSGDSSWADTAKADFFDLLDAGTYGDASSCGGTQYFPGDTNDYIERHKCQRGGSIINIRAWDMQYMPWVAGILGNPGQQDAFINDSILDALNNMDDSLGILRRGLAGAVHGLALVNHTSFPAIDAPNFQAIDGIDNLCELADALLDFQESNGSFGPNNQSTAYAILALVAAQDAGCGPYDTEIADARAYLWTQQDGSDGAFWSTDAQTDKNIQYQGDALMALATSTDVSLVSDVCSEGGAESVTVDINMSDMPGIEIVGGQFRLQYDTDTLSNPSVAVGDAPFTVLVYEDIDTTAGTIDLAVGVPGSSGTDQATTMARITFDATEDCTVDDLVTFRPDDPPFVTKLSDNFGNAVFPPLTDLHPVTIDGTDPTITAPADIEVYAEAGTCEATVDLFNTQIETFDTNPDLNVWVVDRYEPHCFESEFFDGDNRLKLCIHEDDAQGGSGFTNTQGRKKDLDPAVWSMSVDLYVPNDWATSNRRMAGIWGEGHSQSFAIIEFTSGTPGFESTTDDPANAGNPEPRFRAWASGIGWVDMGLPASFTYDAWHTLTISLIGSEYVYEVGNLSLSLPASGAQEIDWAFLQGYNTPAQFTTGVTYDIHWDNFTVQEMPAVASDNCDLNPTITATRDDNEPLDAPYPAGDTVITWTATDACGNFSTDTQTVTVLGQTQMEVAVELGGGVINAGPFERCITVELYQGGSLAATVEEVVTFTNGSGSVTIEVPCGLYDECVTVRDKLHTLRSTGTLSIDGTDYVVSGDDPLVGGDLNDDGIIDILDFGVFVWQFQLNPGADTDCTQVYIPNQFAHADINGDDETTQADVQFVFDNFFMIDAVCPGPLGMPQRRVGLSRISVRELHQRGLGHLAVADLNGDGWVDEQDIVLFMRGVRP